MNPEPKVGGSDDDERSDSNPRAGTRAAASSSPGPRRLRGRLGAVGGSARRRSCHPAQHPGDGHHGGDRVVHRDAPTRRARSTPRSPSCGGVERTMSRFRADSDIGPREPRRGRGPGRRLRRDRRGARRRCAGRAPATGRFDPALGRAVALWDVGDRKAPPAAGELRRFAGQRLYRSWRSGSAAASDVVASTSRDGARPRRHRQGLRGGPRGRCAARLGHPHALVNAGGDLYALGRSPEGDPWEVGVQSPVRPEDARRHAAPRGPGGRHLRRLPAVFRARGPPLPPPARPAPPASRGARRRAQPDRRRGTCMAADAAATAVFGCAACRRRTDPGRGRAGRADHPPDLRRRAIMETHVVYCSACDREVKVVFDQTEPQAPDARAGSRSQRRLRRLLLRRLYRLDVRALRPAAGRDAGQAEENGLAPEA
jgi:hypothetical protein